MTDESAFFFSPVRLLTMPALRYWHVAGQPTEFANLDRELDALLERLYRAKAQAGLRAARPDITRYYRVESSPGHDQYVMEVGVPLEGEAPKVGGARLVTLPPLRCAGVLLWGGLAHSIQAYGALTEFIAREHLQPTGENREWNYWFEAVDSPDNVLGVYMGVE